MMRRTNMSVATTAYNNHLPPRSYHSFSNDGRPYEQHIYVMSYLAIIYIEWTLGSTISVPSQPMRAACKYQLQLCIRQPTYRLRPMLHISLHTNGQHPRAHRVMRTSMPTIEHRLFILGEHAKGVTRNWYANHEIELV